MHVDGVGAGWVGVGIHFQVSLRAHVADHHTSPQGTATRGGSNRSANPATTRERGQCTGTSGLCTGLPQCPTPSSRAFPITTATHGVSVMSAAAPSLSFRGPMHRAVQRSDKTSAMNAGNWTVNLPAVESLVNCNNTFDKTKGPSGGQPP
eukprot:CAMPEP_0174328598 /NCGR_PEP_ID=MMETSP0810-20121108/15242_1 /TAXON_ID=73025 ORGANISM="Eutreptiella gymnastica-like, Strain CCMP1594" /NCGR_SAMPLE_ID=MMETSP0810 /ASSEMBLY_ACC=CAM_ASM_000659 /LENGTH=149 /DNA_ID=CAMNT_0015442735 /DNA_START=135 /DNA_END=580 /DNA_ORIENTATION=-